MKNIVGIDKGALKMAMNALERAGKQEILDALGDSCVDINEQSKLERICAELESTYLSLVKRRRSLEIGTGDHADLMNIEFGLRKSFEIIDRISKEKES